MSIRLVAGVFICLIFLVSPLSFKVVQACTVSVPGSCDTNTTLSVTITDGTGTCSDGIQNGDETGVDTGGRCGGGTTPPSGGGGGAPALTTGVTFSGRAYPLSRVSILKDGQLAVTTIAGPDAKFSISLTTLAAGSYNFGVYGEDRDGRRSETFSFPVFITSGATTNVSGIFLAPTIAVDKAQVKRGDNIAIFGQSVPNGDTTIEVNSENQILVKARTDNNGVYSYNFDSARLEIGQHLTRSKAAVENEISEFGKSIVFAVGTKNILFNPDQKCLVRADLNKECRVNLVDFSIAAFWYKRALNDAFRLLEKERLSGDGKVDLKDFSIMAYHWTG